MQTKHLFLGFTLLANQASWAVQSCDTSTITETAPESRFIDNADSTVTDTASGLMWKQCNEGQSGSGCSTGTAAQYSWQGALQAAESLNSGTGFAGFSDWRLPNIKELSSLVEVACSNPAVNLAVFPNTQVGDYFSSTPKNDELGYAYALHTIDGTTLRLHRSTSNTYLRLVRGPL